jgi:hypothetical protein
LSDKAKQETIIEKIKKHWLFSVIVIVAVSAGTTWSIANGVIEQQRKIIEYQKVEIGDLNDKVDKLKIEIDNYRPCLPNSTLKITSPRNGDKVPVSSLIRGTFSGELQKGWYMWVILNPRTAPGLWWPQSKRVDPMNGLWNIQAWFGDDKEFDIAVVLVNETDDQYYSDYIRKGGNKRDYPGISLPDSAIIMDLITVTKE